MAGIFVSSPREAIANISRFLAAVEHDPGLRDRAGYVRSWYAHRDASGTWQFAPSRFVGYQNAEDHISQSGPDGERDGRQTERVLGAWFEAVREGTRLERELRQALRSFLAGLNQAPNARARISVLHADIDESAPMSNAPADFLGRISSDPQVCGGRPCIKGTRMRVVDIVEAIAHGATREDLLRDFDYLTGDDIAAALLYAARAADHRVVRTA